MNDLSILEPHKYYPEFKQKLIDNANQYFDNLLKLSEVNLLENQELVKKLNLENKKLNSINKKIAKTNMLKGFMIFLIVLGGIGLIVSILLFLLKIELYIPIIILVVSVVIAVTGIVMLSTKIRNDSYVLSAKQAKQKEILQNLTNTINLKNTPLFNLFDYNIPSRIITKTIPLIQLDEYFDIQKFTYLNQKYGFGNIVDKNTSTVFDISGSINGNPFLFVRNFKTYMGSKIYTGSIVISWSETQFDSKGRSYIVHRSQTLTASVSKPCPFYQYETYLVYGNDAAPNLSFTRQPSGSKEKTEKQIDKMVKNRSDDLVKKSQDAVSKGESFTLMANKEFESLFNATNRDNEVEFRLLFTPLCQKTYIDMIRGQKPFGDDFIFEKKRCLNFIISQHSQNRDIYAKPERYYGLDINDVKKRFVDYILYYFEGMFFDLAPLLAIPIYQQQKPIEYIYKKKFNQNYTNYEHEVLANSLGPNHFKHPNTATDVILKTSYNSCDGKIDKVKVTAYSYEAIPRVDFISQMGGDGQLHQIPVRWIEYLPLENESYMGIRNITKTKPEVDKLKDKLSNYFGNNNTYHFERGLLAFLLANDYTNDKDLNNIFNALNINENHNKEEK